LKWVLVVVSITLLVLLYIHHLYDILIEPLEAVLPLVSVVLMTWYLVLVEGELRELRESVEMAVYQMERAPLGVGRVEEVEERPITRVPLTPVEPTTVETLAEVMREVEGDE